MHRIQPNEGSELDSGSLAAAILTRRAVRHFAGRPVGRASVEQLLELANHAPSSYNLQPWHFVAVDDSETKEALRSAAFGQAQVTEAPWVIALVVDPDVARTHLESVLEQSIRVGAIPPDHAVGTRKLASLSFHLGPLGLAGLAKGILFRMVGLFRPAPAVPTTRSALREYWGSESLLAADHLMLAARAFGLDTCPMRGFDPGRVRRILGVPGRMEVALLIPLGYAQPEDRPAKPRLPLREKVHWNRFSARG